jgi:Zn-dependent protease/predicted transcriptional regulator
MKWSFKIARIAGIDVRIHVTFVLLLAWIAWSNYTRAGADAAQSGVLFILALFGCVLLHEFGHAVAARRYGIKTPDITLLPIGGVARLERMPDKPSQELVVALAGPMVNVVIAAVLLLFNGGWGNISDLTAMRGSMLSELIAVNIWLVIFNMVPALPMDGGRVLRALLAMRMGHARATQLSATIGQGIAFIFGFLGLMYNPMLILIAVFVYMGASQEAAMAQIKTVTQNILIRDAMITNFVSLYEHSILQEGIEALLKTSQHEFPVLNLNGDIAGVITRNDIIAGLQAGGPQMRVADVMRRDIPSVHVSSPFEKAFELMQQSQCPALPVTDSGGKLVGLITPENIGEMMMISTALSKGGRPAWRNPQA